MPHDHSHWMFHRDEVDLLEETFDDLYERHTRAPDASAHAMEERILREQVETEDAFEEEWLLQFGLPEPKPFTLSSLPQADDPDLEDAIPLRDMLQQSTIRDPFYERVFEWASRVFSWAKERYEKGCPRSPDVFRVYVNAPLVPVKLAFALSEEQQDDRETIAIAEKEGRLASVYLDRIRSAFTVLQSEGMMGEHERDLVEEAEMLGRDLAAYVRRLSSLRKFGGGEGLGPTV